MNKLFMEKVDLHVLTVNDEEKDVRIDSYISSKLQDISRSFVQKLIDNGEVRVNDRQVKSNYKVKSEDIIKISLPQPKQLSVEKENIELDVVYEDIDIIIINKPQGMVVHPAPGNYTGTLVNAIMYHCKDLSGINGVLRPGIVHRIDKDTSGLLMVAKNDNSHISLARQLKDHSINRIYYALVHGRVKEDKLTIDAPLARHQVERKKIAVVTKGRRAVTHIEVVQRFVGYTLVKAKLETGRTHQIRVHMSYIGHPLVGDPVYGPKKSPFKTAGQLLHASTIGFIHPRTNQYMEFNTKLPEYFDEIINKLTIIQ